jgi:hypothetical protein
MSNEEDADSISGSGGDDAGFEFAGGGGSEKISTGVCASGLGTLAAAA